MYFKTTKKELLKPLKMIIGVVEQRQTLPVLANILTTVKDDTLNLTASDMEVEITYRLPLATDNLLSKDNEGEITIPARKFFDICKSLSENDDIQINVEKNQALLKVGKSKFKLQTLPAEDFPSTPELDNPTQFSIEQHQLKNLLYKTSFAVAKNDVRYYLTGLLLEIADNKITLVGTNGHRMAVVQDIFQSNTFIMSEKGTTIIESDQKAKAIIPRKAIGELTKLLQDNDDEVVVLFDDNHIRFELAEGLTLTSKLIDSNFPCWQDFIPTNQEIIDQGKNFSIETAVLKQALLRVSILSHEKYKGVRLGLEPRTLNISAKNASQEAAEEELEIEYDGEELEIGLNGVYLLEALNVIATKNVQFAFKDSDNACLITEEGNDDCKLIVMPMRL